MHANLDQSPNFKFEGGSGIKPIGYFRADAEERYAVGRQSGLIKNQGKIVLNAGCQFEQALQDLEGFERVWLIYGFHKNVNWKPKILPPRGEKKRGVFATRSPHRPNFLGLSCVKLKSVKRLAIEIEEHDLLDGTPIFDIKPYIVYADSFPTAKQGWVDELETQKKFTLHWSPKALQKADYLKVHGDILIEKNINPRLEVNPLPTKNNRIHLLKEELYEIAYKSWRISFKIEDQTVHICDIYSGYKLGETNSKWNDLPIHEAFSTFIPLY